MLWTVHRHNHLHYSYSTGYTDLNPASILSLHPFYLLSLDFPLKQKALLQRCHSDCKKMKWRLFRDFVALKLKRAEHNMFLAALAAFLTIYMIWYDTIWYDMTTVTSDKMYGRTNTLTYINVQHRLLAIIRERKKNERDTSNDKRTEMFSPPNTPSNQLTCFDSCRIRRGHFDPASTPRNETRGPGMNEMPSCARSRL